MKKKKLKKWGFKELAANRWDYTLFNGMYIEYEEFEGEWDFYIANDRSRLIQISWKMVKKLIKIFK